MTRRLRPAWLCLPALACMVGAALAQSELSRPLVLQSGRESVSVPSGPRLTPQDVPAAFAPRDFPRVLRSEELPGEPRGVLWRKLRERHPQIDPRQLLLRPLGATAPEGAGEKAEPVNIHILALLVDFLADGGGDGSTTADGRFDRRHPDSARIAVDPPPHDHAYFNAHLESLRRYYFYQSRGQLRLTWDIYPAESDSAYHLSDTAEYGPWLISSTNEEILALAEKLVRDTFATADTSENPPDFRAYDSFIMFHAGADLQGDINRDSPYDIPSFNIELAEPVAVQDSTFFIDLIMVMPELVSQDGFLGALNGVMTHEYGHQLGFFDLYNVLTFFPQVGMFSLMDSGDNLFGTIWDPYEEVETFVRGAIPGSIDPWHKLTIPFLRDGQRPIFVDGGLELALEAVQSEHRMAVVPLGGERVFDGDGNEYLEFSEYFILENRPYDLNGDGTVYLRADSTTGVIMGPINIPTDVTDSLGWAPDELGEFEQDFLLPGSGILIWHVDNVAISDAFSYCFGCINVLEDRRGVDIEEADGIEDLGDIFSVEWTGGRYDYWFQGGYTHLGPETHPNSNSTGGGISGINIDVRDSAGVSVEVAISAGRTREGWPLFVGAPRGREFVSVADLDADGFDEILSAAGRYVLALEADGRGLAGLAGGVLGETDSLLLPGVAVHTGFVGAQRREVLIAAATGSRVHAWASGGASRMVYPPAPEVLPSLRFTTPPMLCDSILVIGDSQGRLRGLLPGDPVPLRWRTPTPGFAVSAIAGGDLFGDGSTALVWGNEVGELFVATGTERDGFAVAGGWPRKVGDTGSAVAWLLLIAGRAGEAGSIVAVCDDGHVVLLSVAGEIAAGWPRSLDADPAGPPAVGDADDDGELEILATGTDGRVHIWNLRGQDEWFWPRSVWHPDRPPHARVLSGPILFDANADGRPEILQGGGDGTLHLLDYEGEELPGWPAVVGFRVATGPLVAQVEAAEEGTPGSVARLQLLAADEGGFATMLTTGWAARGAEPGEMWRSDLESSRTRIYPAALHPTAETLADLIDEESIQLTPNPVRGTRGALRVRMGKAGTLRVRLLDTSGHQVWERTFEPAVGPAGDLLPLDLEDLAPGLYVAMITAEAGAERAQLTRKLALVR